jgi:hypothetical protein
MPDSLPPSEVTSMEVVEVREKANFPGQRRAHNYVVRVSTIDAETGESILTNEYRTLSSDKTLSSEQVIRQLTNIIEESL